MSDFVGVGKVALSMMIPILNTLEADMIIPNFTELSLIVGADYPEPEKIDHSLVMSWLEKVRNKGVKSAIITSVPIKDRHYVYGFSQSKDIFRVEVDYISVEVGGSGDVFTSLILGIYTKGLNLQNSVEHATEALTNIIREEYRYGVTEEVNEIKIQNHLQYIYDSLKKPANQL